MAFTRVQRQTNVLTGVSSIAVALTGCTAGNLLVAKVYSRLASGASGPPNPTLTDSLAGTTWSPAGQGANKVDPGFTRRITIVAGILAASGNDTVTATLSVAGDAILVVEEWHSSTGPWTSADASTLKDTIVNNDGVGTAASASGTAAGAELFVSGIAALGTASITIGGTTTDDTGGSPLNVDSENWRDGHELVVAGAIGVSATLGSSETWLICSIALKDAGAGPGTPAKLGLTQQPSGQNRSAVALRVQPKVAVQDSGGTTVPTATNNATVSITPLGTGTAALSGTLTVAAVAGIATFTDLVVTGQGPYRLTFAASGLTSAVSNFVCTTRTGIGLDAPTAVTQAVRPIGTRIITVLPSNSADFATKLAAAVAGDILECSGTYSGPFTIPSIAAGWITIQRAGLGIPATSTRGKRTSPTEATSLGFPTFVATGTNNPCFKTSVSPLSQGVWFRECQFTATPGSTQDGGLIALGTDGGVGGGGQDNATLMATRFGLERCVGGAPNDTTNVRRVVALQASQTTIIDCDFGPAHEPSAECQAIAGWNGSGPWLIDNNKLSAAGEVFILGGSDSADSTLQPGDLTFRRNYCYVNPAWKTNGLLWFIKNQFELKNCRRALVEYNVFDGMFRSGQDGHAIALKSVNQGNNAPWSGSSDIEFRYNIVKNAGGAFDIGANPDNSNVCWKLARLSIHDNWVFNINPVQGGTFNSDSPLMLLQQGGIADLVFEHNTCYGPSTPEMALGDTGTGAKAIALGPGFDPGSGTYVAIDPTLGGSIRGNIMDFGFGGVTGDGNTGETALDTYMPGVVQATNLLVNSTSPNITDPTRKITSATAVTSFAQNVDGSLPGGSPYHAAAWDGKDYGADFSVLTPGVLNTVAGWDNGGGGGGGGGGATARRRRGRYSVL